MKIKVPFTITTPDFKHWESKLLDVTIHADFNNVIHSDFEYSVTIPDFMFNELANSEPKFKTEYDINNKNVSGLFSDRTIKRKFMKTQTAMSISQLQQYISSLTQYLNDKYSMEKSTMRKKLIIYFDHSSVHTTNNLNNAYTGEETKQVFRYFTAYEVLTDKFSGLNREVKKQYISKILYAHPNSSINKIDTGFKEKDDLFLKLLHNETIESFEKKYSIVDWSQEREDFCKKIQDTFKRVNTELSEFLKNIDSEKMDALMYNNGMNFLSDGK